MKDKLQRLAECLPKELGAVFLFKEDFGYDCLRLASYFHLWADAVDVTNGSALILLLDAMEKTGTRPTLCPPTISEKYDEYMVKVHYVLEGRHTEHVGPTRTKAIVNAALAVFGGEAP